MGGNSTHGAIEISVGLASATAQLQTSNADAIFTHMIGDFRDDLLPEIARTEAIILQAISQLVPTAKLKRIGPIDFDPPEWACWIVTSLDEERDRLACDASLNERLVLAANAGFPPTSFTFQSEETVARDYKGSWFYAMR